MDNKKARMMPHNIEAEQAVLGCNLIDNDIAVSIIAKLKVDDFYTNAHQTIFEAMIKVFNKNVPIDYVTVMDELEASGGLEAVGGIEYLVSLTNVVPSAANYTHYVDIVKKDSLLRKLIKASDEIVQKAYAGEDEDTLGFAEKSIFDIARQEETSSLTQVATPVANVISKLDEIARNKGKIVGVPTGFKCLDNLTNGLHAGQLVILAARPGVGKTSFAMNVVTHASVECGKTCAVFSLEMPNEEVAQRSMFSISGVDMGKGLKGIMDKDEYKAIWAAGKKLSDAKLFIDDSSAVTPADIRSKCMRLKREQGLDLVMIDYLQLMNGTGKYKDSSRQNEISELTRTLKITAKELGVPILLLSQLSRDSEKRKEHEPMLSDLRDSGSIEQDADMVMFLHNPANYNDVKIDPDQVGIVKLIVAKNRNGSQGTFDLRWIGENTTFKDIDYKPEQKQQPRNDDMIPPPEAPELAETDEDVANDLF